MKAVAATAALQISEKPAVAFSFNLTPEAIVKAMACPTGFLDSLKRSLDRVLSTPLPYWFAIDINPDKRLHIQGAFAADDAELPAIRKAMKEAWAEWDGPGKHKQLWFSPKPCDDGWATYSMRNHRQVAKIIGPRTFTINQPLRRDAEWTYGAIRRIMRSKAGG